MSPTLPASLLDPTNYAYRERDSRAPAVPEGHTILIDEPGRVLDNVCYRAFSFRVTKEQFGDYILRVRHGGGDESWRMEWRKRVVGIIEGLDSDSRFLMLHALMRAHQQSATITAERVAANWRKAAAEKRIKTRKLPGKNAVKVWVEPEVVPSRSITERAQYHLV